jgi:hypothetical protein
MLYRMASEWPMVATPHVAMVQIPSDWISKTLGLRDLSVVDGSCFDTSRLPRTTTH